MKILKTKTGFSVRYKTEFGVRSTRLQSTNEKDAKREVRDAKIAELEAAANSGALTMDVVSKLMAGRKMSVSDALVEWNDWRESEGKSMNTINTQTDFIYLFCKHSYGLNEPVNGITHKMISKWVNEKKSKTGVSTRNAWLSALSAFLAFCSTRQYIPKNPASIVSVNMSKLSHKQKEKKKVVPFTEKEYEKIIKDLDGCFRDDEVNEFWKGVCSLSFWLGLRLGDCINLEWASVKSKSVVVWTEKRDARVELPIMPNALKSFFSGVEYNGGKYVFKKEYRDKISDPKKRHYFSQQFRTVCDKSEIEGKSFHSFRHAFATRHKNLPLEEVAKLLGHKDTKTTQKYTH